MKPISRIRVGMLTIPIGGTLGLVGILLRGPNALPLPDADAWANAAGSGSFSIGQILLIAAFVLPFIGFWAMYAYLQESVFEQGAFWGFMFSLMGTALALPALGISAFGGPPAAAFYLQGDANAAAIITDALTGKGLIVGLIAGILYTAGPLLLGIAAWRSDGLSRWAAGAFAIHGIMLSFGFSFFPVLVLGWILLAVSGVEFSFNASK